MADGGLRADLTAPRRKIGRPQRHRKMAGDGQVHGGYIKSVRQLPTLYECAHGADHLSGGNSAASRQGPSRALGSLNSGLRTARTAIIDDRFQVQRTVKQHPHSPQSIAMNEPRIAAAAQGRKPMICR